MLNTQAAELCERASDRAKLDAFDLFTMYHFYFMKCNWQAETNHVADLEDVKDDQKLTQEKFDEAILEREKRLDLYLPRG